LHVTGINSETEHTSGKLHSEGSIFRYLVYRKGMADSMRPSLLVRFTLGLLLLTAATVKPGFSHEVYSNNLLSNLSGLGLVEVKANTSSYVTEYNSNLAVSAFHTGTLNAYGPFGGNVTFTVTCVLDYDGDYVVGNNTIKNFTLHGVPYSSPYDSQSMTTSATVFVPLGSKSLRANTNSAGTDSQVVVNDYHTVTGDI
jgi:hypothetical protein